MDTVSQWHHICDFPVTRMREPCNGRIRLSPHQSRDHGCPLPAAGSLRSSTSPDGKQMKPLLPLMCPPWSIPPPAVEDGTHPKGRVFGQYHPKGNWQVETDPRVRTTCSVWFWNRYWFRLNSGGYFWFHWRTLDRRNMRQEFTGRER